MLSNKFIRLRGFFTSMTLIRNSIFSTYNGYIALNETVIIFQPCRDFWYSSGDVLATDPPHTVVRPAKLQCMPGAFSHTQSLFRGFPGQICMQFTRFCNYQRYLNNSDTFLDLWDQHTGLHWINLTWQNVHNDICDHAQSSGPRSLSSCRVTWSNTQFVY